MVEKFLGVFFGGDDVGGCVFVDGRVGVKLEAEVGSVDCGRAKESRLVIKARL